MERLMGLEPTTFSLGSGRPTTGMRGQSGTSGDTVPGVERTFADNGGH